VLADSATFWGRDGAQNWDAAEATLDTAPGGQAAPAGPGSQCCGAQREAGGADDASASVCCA